MSIERDEFRKELYGVINNYTNKIDLQDLLGELYSALKQTEYHFCRQLLSQDREALPNPFEGEV
jgi:hypothetical protein